MTAFQPPQNRSKSVYRPWIPHGLIAGLFASSQAFAALSLPPSLTTGVQTFASTPPAADWSTVSITGAAGTLATVAAVDTAVQALTASGITTVLGTQTANPTNVLAQRTSGGTSFIYTAATANNATVLMSTLQNDSGGPVAAISISYAYTRIGTGVEESMGHRAFYSLTGLANSWTLIPGLSNIATNQTLTTSATFVTPWASGAKLYLLWVDDNGSGTDTPFTIDDFSVTSINPPPVVTLVTPAGGAVASGPGSFNLTATASDDGTITQVEFLRNGVVVNTDTLAPYSYTDAGLSVGNYTYTARATDNSAGTSLSAPASVTVFTDATNTALAFDGVDDCVTMGAATSTLGAATFTLECWFKRTGAGIATTTGGNGLATAIPLVTKGRGEADATATVENTQDCNYFMGIDSATNKLCADFEAKLGSPLNGTGATNNNYPVFGSTVITNNVWYHAAATWENGAWKLYLNGALESMTVPNLIPTPPPIPQSGSLQHFGLATAMDTAGVRAGFFQGTMDEVRVWSLARSAAEIAAGKNIEIVAGTGLIGRYGLNEAIGNSAGSSIGTPTGTLSNGPLWVDGAPFVANVPPTVALTAPVDNTSVLSGSTVGFAATASDGDGTVSNVEFYQGTIKLGEDLTPPYTFDWTATTVGDFTLTAKAIDNNAASTTSAAVTLHVTQNAAPLVALTAPADNSSLIAPAATTLAASASDGDGSIVKVEFFNGAAKLGEDISDPYTYDWSGIGMGDYTLTAKSTDNLGLVTTSGIVTLHVTAPATTPPTVALTSPADGTNFIFPASIDLTADAADADGSVVKVEFFNGVTKLGEDTNAPYTFTWSGAAVGDYTVTAKATDNLTATTTSAAITVHVLANQPPVVTLNAPANNATGIGTSTNLLLTIADPEAAAQTVTYYGRRTTPATPGADFVIATLPDTQFYAENLNNNGRAATFLAQTQWLVHNRNSLNLAFVSHMGDIVQNGDAVPAEWIVADTAMKKIESQLDTLRAYGIPWGAAPGNYDQTGIAGAGGANSYYNQFFPASRYVGRNYWGGSQSPANNHNNYQLFSASGLDFIIIHLEYDTRAKSSYQTVLDWADALMKANPDRRAIVTTHWTVDTGNPAAFSNQGQNIYNDLKDNPNFFMMLGGHVPGEGRRTDTFEGRTVHSLLQDYQGRSNGGDGWLRYFIFSPSSNTITAKTYRVSNPVNPAAGSFETDADSEFTLAYPMQGPVTAWIPLGTVNVPVAGTTASLAWTGLEAGKDYEWHATVNDAVNTVTTATRRFSTAANAAPTVSITAPQNNASLVAPASLTLTADAADGDGSITRVEFYQGNTKLGEDVSAPYEQAVSGLIVGTYTFSAVAVDNSASATLSAAVKLTVNAGSWSYSQNFDGLGVIGTSITALAGWSAGHFNPNVQRSTTGGNGLVTVTDALTVDNGGAGTTTPALLNLGTTGAVDRALGSFPRTTPAGDHFMQVAITNDSGAPITSFNLSYRGEEWRNTSTPVQQLTLWFGNTNATNGFSAMPAFTFNSPNNTGGNTAIDGNAVGNFALITGTYIPASPIAAGSTFYLRWYDVNDDPIADDYLAIDDLSITLPVGLSPVAALTAPANGSVHYLGGTINLTANASDSDGTITKVEFYQGTTKLGEDSDAPYSYDWSGYAIGNYSLTAKAIDNSGNITTSTAAVINVYATPGSGTLTRGPYLNSASHNQIVVRWRSSQSIVGRVRYGTSTASLDQTVDETIAKTDHEVKLTGLDPYTRYYYSVGSAFDALTPQVAENTSYTPGAPAPTAADYTFRTSPTPGTAVNTRIWIVGDCGRGTQVQADGRNAYYSYNGSASFTGTRIPDLNLQMGDNAYNSGTDAEYTTGYYNMYANIFRKMPQWSCLGNHDANNGSTSTTANFPYFDMFTFPTAAECGGVASGTERYYSFNYGNIHFICLDSQASLTTVDNPATTGVNEDGPMATWLRADLAANTATWTIAFWHHPPYSKGSHDSDTATQLVTMRTNFNPIMEAGAVDLLYFGHSHNYERSFLLDNSAKFNSGNGSIGGFTTSGSGKIRNAANGFIATATVNGTVTPGDGAYIKPLTGPRDHFGAVYNTAGMSGLAETKAIDHPVMHICYNAVGTVNLDVNGNTLTSTFVQSGGAKPDNFTITKQGAADTDHDGIPDEYEIANGLNRYVNDSGTTDTDGDGTTNMSEFIFGQSANVPDHYGWTTTTDPLTRNVTVNFPTLVGRTYRVLYSQTLLGWLDGSGVVTGDGSTKSWTDDGTITGTAPAVTPKRFYRVTASTVDP